MSTEKYAESETILRSGCSNWIHDCSEGK